AKAPGASEPNPATDSEASHPPRRGGLRAVVHRGQAASPSKGSAMPAERLQMRQVREVLRLPHAWRQSGHRIATAVGISRGTVTEYQRRAAVVGITWPVPPELDDAALERKLFTPP